MSFVDDVLKGIDGDDPLAFLKGMGEGEALYRICRHCSKPMKITRHLGETVEDHPLCKGCDPLRGVGEQAMPNITVCPRCASLYEASSGEEADSPHRRCRACHEESLQRLKDWFTGGP